jgi:hypothetical protein
VLPPVEAPPHPAEHPAAIAPEGSTSRRLLPVALVALLAGLLVFLAIQTLLGLYDIQVIRDAIARGLVDGYSLSLRDRLLPALIHGVMGYLIIAAVGLAIAGKGHRLLFAVPAAAYVLTDFIVGPVHQPEPIGTAWGIHCYSMNSFCSGPWFAHAWVGSLVDLALVALPGCVVAVRVRSRWWPGVADPPEVAAILTVVAAVVSAGWAIAVIEGYLHVRELVAVAAAGLLIGTARRWWPWLPILLAAFVTGALGWIWYPILFPDPSFPFSQAWPYVLEATWPTVAVGLVASGWQPLAWLLRRAQRGPVTLVIAVNLLNVGDAVLTALAVNSGGALEANPVVRVAGLPAKVALVGLLTWLLYRRRPAALVWPAAALVAVSCYQVTGILVNGWR